MLVASCAPARPAAVPALSGTAAAAHNVSAPASAAQLMLAHLHSLFCELILHLHAESTKNVQKCFKGLYFGVISFLF